MHDERGVCGLCGAAEFGVALAALMLLTPARARALGGHATVQVQDIEQRIELLNPDGSKRSIDVSRQLWTQTYDLAHTLNPRPDWSVFWQFQLNDVSASGVTQTQRTPYGAFRVNHPVAGFTASYRPVTSKNGSIDPSGVERITTQRRQETVVTAYLAPPALPRLDLSWQRTHRVSLFPLTETGITRSARLTWDRGTLGVHGGYGDVDQTSLTNPAGAIQRNFDGGAAWRAIESGRRSLTLAYDFAGNRSERGRTDRSQSHNASAAAQYRSSSRAQWSFFTNWRRSLVDASTHSDIADFESSLFYNLQATRVVRLLAGGGTRTARTETSTGQLSYVSTVVAADGPVRRGWKATGSLSNVVNWGLAQPAYSVQSAHGASRLDVVRGAKLDLDVLINATHGTAARDGRYVVQNTAGLEAALLRNLSVTLSVRRYQSGPGLFDAAAESRTMAASVRVRPLPKLDVVADVTSSGALPHNNPLVRNTRVNATWSPSSRWRLSGYYTRSDRTQTIAVADALRGQEIVGGRVLSALSRSLNLNAGVNVAEPGRATRSRQADASLTWSFGGPS